MRLALCVSEDMNLGVAYIVSYLKEQGHEVGLFFDSRQFARNYAQNKTLARWLSVEDYNVNRIAKFKPDICGISSISATYDWACQMARRIKEVVKCKIVFGGVHPTLVPEEVRSKWFVDDVCVGDGIKYFGGEFNPELWPDREIFLDCLPPIHRKVQIFMTGFGCPFRCSFCNNHQLYKKIVRRDAKDCINELKFLYKRGLRYVLFVDDIFTIHSDWLIRFCSLYKELNLPFTCFGHPRYLDDGILESLKRANCQMIWLGIQTADEKLRKEVLNRHETNREIFKACVLIKKHGIKLMIDHIFGIPTETEESIKESYSFYKSLRPDVVNCYEMLYFPKANINKYGAKKTQYQNQGGEHYKKYIKSLVSIPLMGS